MYNMDFKPAETFTITGMWLRNITDMDLLLSYNLLGITRILCVMMRLRQFGYSDDGYDTIKYITITGAKSVSMKTVGDGNYVSVQTAACLYISILRRWVRVHIRSLTEDEYRLIDRTMASMSTAIGMDTIQAASRSLVDVLSLSGCDGECIDVDVAREHGCCTINVRNGNVLTMLSGRGLLDMFYSLSEHIIETNMPTTMFVDMQATTITCTGQVRSLASVNVEDHLVAMKKLYFQCIIMWVNFNGSVAGTSMRLLNSKHELARCNTMGEFQDFIEDLTSVVPSGREIIGKLYRTGLQSGMEPDGNYATDVLYPPDGALGNA